MLEKNLWVMNNFYDYGYENLVIAISNNYKFEINKYILLCIKIFLMEMHNCYWHSIKNAIAEIFKETAVRILN